MNVTRKEQRIIQRALNARQASGELTPRTASGWRKRCASPLRLAAPEPLCLLDRAGLRADFPGSLFADSELVAWLLSLFSHSALMRILLPALLAVVCYGWGFAASGGRRSGTTAPRRFCFWASSLPRWRYGSLANGWITAAAISHRCFWPDA